jgi:polyphosphate kinase
LWDILQVCLEDRRSAWQMQPDGTYRQLDCAELAADDPRAMGTHARLIALSRDRAAVRALPAR